jgi:phosphoglucosamine mutase
MKLFGTDGIRGTANEYPITPELALKLGRVLPRILQPASNDSFAVLIARDTRISGTMLESALVSGLLSEGADVLTTGPLPTPAAAFLTTEMECQAGIMLTASHNPFEDNGIKIFGSDGYKLNDAAEAQVEEFLLGNDLATSNQKVGSLTTLTDATERYLAFAQKSIGDATLKGLKVVVDCAHGAGYFAGPRLLEQLGVTVIPLGVEPDGRNINAGVGSLHPEKAAAAVKEHSADLAICLDGDADRLTLVDGNGDVVNGDKLLCLCALGLKRRGLLAKDTVVATVMSNLGLQEALAKNGIAFETTAVGDRNVLERMREKGYNFGGENSGHLIFSDHATTGDGLMAALQVLAEMRATGKPVAQLADCMTVFPQKLVNLAVTEKPAIEDIPGLTSLIAEAEKVMGDDGRVLIRYSGTEKKIRVMVEARKEQIMKHWCDQLSELVQKEIGA